MTRRPAEVWAYLAAVVTAIIGLGSLFLFGFFVWTGGLQIADMKMGWRGALIWDVTLSLAFFLQHSGMVRRSFRRRLGRWLPEHWHGVLYTIASGVFLVLLSVFWQPSGVSVFALEGPVRWFMQGLILLSCAGMAWSFRVIGEFDAFGTRAFLSHLRREPPHPAPFIVKGPYRWMRHPVYFFGIVVILARPSLSLDGLVFDVLLTVWLVIGTILEERDLVVEFGNTYRAYQQSVPMLLPWRLPPPIRPSATCPRPGD